jgi:BirA family biotin operon repressor/biotin-[acetyl-CoA-carboxylase] ligase
MGLYFSVVLRPALAAEDLPKITLAAGLAVSKAVEAEYDVTPQIKWPNDLLLGGRKFGGILTETGSLQNMPPGQHPLVVVGVGLNLFPPEGGFPPELKERATSLSLHVEQKIATEILLETSVKAIEEMLQRLEAGNFPVILSEWMQRDATKDRVLTWITPRGKEVTGVSMGPDADGVLYIRDGEGTVHAVLSGDVNLVGKIPERQP